MDKNALYEGLGLDMAAIGATAGITDAVLKKSEAIFIATNAYAKERLEAKLTEGEAKVLGSAVLHLIGQVELVRKLVRERVGRTGYENSASSG